jgi:hypothetical protein
MWEIDSVGFFGGYSLIFRNLTSIRVLLLHMRRFSDANIQMCMPFFNVLTDWCLDWLLKLADLPTSHDKG